MRINDYQHDLNGLFQKVFFIPVSSFSMKLWWFIPTRSLIQRCYRRYLRTCPTPGQRYYAICRQNSNSPTRPHKGHQQVRKATLIVICKCLLHPTPLSWFESCKEGKNKLSLIIFPNLASEVFCCFFNLVSVSSVIPNTVTILPSLSTCQPGCKNLFPVLLSASGGEPYFTHLPL